MKDIAVECLVSLVTSVNHQSSLHLILDHVSRFDPIVPHFTRYFPPVAVLYL